MGGFVVFMSLLIIGGNSIANDGLIFGETQTDRETEVVIGR